MKEKCKHKRVMGVRQTFRVLISRDDRRAVSAAGGCISYLTAPSPTQVYLEGKKEQLERVLKYAKVTALSEPEPIPLVPCIYTRVDGELVQIPNQIGG